MNFGTVIAVLGGAATTLIALTGISLLMQDDDAAQAVGRLSDAQDLADESGEPVLVMTPVFPKKKAAEKVIASLKEAGRDDDAARLELIMEVRENGEYHEKVSIAAEYTRMNLIDEVDDLVVAELLAKAQKEDPFHAASGRVAAAKKTLKEVEAKEEAQKDGEGAEAEAKAEKAELQSAT